LLVLVLAATEAHGLFLLVLVLAATEAHGLFLLVLVLAATRSSGRAVGEATGEGEGECERDLGGPGFPYLDPRAAPVKSAAPDAAHARVSALLVGAEAAGGTAVRVGMTRVQAGAERALRQEATEADTQHDPKHQERRNRAQQGAARAGVRVDDISRHRPPEPRG